MLPMRVVKAGQSLRSYQSPIFSSLRRHRVDQSFVAGLFRGKVKTASSEPLFLALARFSSRNEGEGKAGADGQITSDCPEIMSAPSWREPGLPCALTSSRP